MSTTAQSTEGIRTIDEFSDFIITEANKHIDHSTEEFMAKVHKRILKSARQDNVTVEDSVLKAYFRMYALLHNRVVSRTRIIATMEAVVVWLRN